jgi:V/A-type H+-transporting ATPase subunit I
MYWIAITAVLMAINILPPMVSVTVLVVVALVLLLLIFLREPLAALVERKKNWIPENKVEFIVINFFECFEILLSLITNTISFIRVGAFALNHVGMMTVVFLLAKTAGGSTNPVIVIIGNLVVIGLEGLIVGIQVLRLEFYEIFGRFYEGSGKPFEHHGPKLRDKE